MRAQLSRVALPFLFSVALILRLALVIAAPLHPNDTPIPGYNDEPHHLQYVMHLASGAGWPVWRVEMQGAALPTWEYTQPPLYYAVAAQGYNLCEFLHAGWGLHGARLVSLFFGMVAALFLYRMALIWSGDRRIATAAAAALLLAPASLLFTSLVTNDALLICLSSLVFYSLTLCRTEQGGATRQVITGLFMAAAVWSKMSALILFPLAWYAAPPGLAKRESWFARGRVLLTATAVVMPLLAWNLAHYGRLVPLTPVNLPGEVLGVSGGAVAYPVWAASFWLRSAATPLYILWGSALEKTLSLSWVVLWGGLAALGLWRAIRGRMRYGMPLAAIALNVAAFITYNMNLFQVEFRLFAPAFPALAMLTAVGAAAAGLSPVVQATLWALPLVLLL